MGFAALLTIDGVSGHFLRSGAVVARVTLSLCLLPPRCLAPHLSSGADLESLAEVRRGMAILQATFLERISSASRSRSMLGTGLIAGSNLPLTSLVESVTLRRVA
jgi:hypothetical protein